MPFCREQPRVGRARASTSRLVMRQWRCFPPPTSSSSPQVCVRAAVFVCGVCVWLPAHGKPRFSKHQTVILRRLFFLKVTAQRNDAAYEPGDFPLHACNVTWQGCRASTEGQSGTSVVGFAGEEIQPGIWQLRATAAAY